MLIPLCFCPAKRISAKAYGEWKGVALNSAPSKEMKRRLFQMAPLPSSVIQTKVVQSYWRMSYER